MKMEFFKKLDITKIIIALLLLLIIAWSSFLIKSQTYTKPIVREIIIPKYNITYNISEIINTTIFKIPDNKFVLIVYSSEYEKINLSKALEIAEAYKYKVYLYDISKPWYGLRLTQNITLPLVPLTPTPILFCVNNNSVHALIGKPLEDTESLIMLFEKCNK